MHGAYLFLCHRGDHYLFLLTFCHSFAGHVQEELLYINWQIKLNLFRRKIIKQTQNQAKIGPHDTVMKKNERYRIFET